MPTDAPKPGVYSHRGTRAIQRMVEYAPSSGSLALWIHHLDVDGDEEAPAATNDGTSIRYGPAFERLSLARQAGLVAHEVLHVALRHAPRYLELRRQIGDVDLELYNICADAIVNSALDHLSWLEVGEGPRLDILLAATLQIRTGVEQALLEWDLERLYRAIDDRRPTPQRGMRGAGDRPSRQGGRGGSREGSGSGPSEAESRPAGRRDDGPLAARVRALGRHSLRDLVPAGAGSRPEREAEYSREWHERIVRGHAGDGIHSLLRALLADLPKVHTPWEQILRTQLARGLSLRPDLSWSRPSRSYIANHGRTGDGKRLPWEPGRSANKAVARLAVMVDVSGSIEDPLLERFAREIEAITRRMEAQTLVVIGDDRVRGVESFAPGRSNLREIRFEGGGGTDFSPLLEEADRWRPDIGVFLTDLEGPATYRPAFPVIWTVTRAAAAMPQPFGRKLVLE